MKGVLGTALLAIAVLGTVSCEKIKSQIRDIAGSELEVLPDSESLAGADGLPVVNSFRTVTPSTMASFTGAGDRISVVEFYSDT